MPLAKGHQCGVSQAVPVVFCKSNAVAVTATYKYAGTRDAVFEAGRLDDADWFPRSSTSGVEVGGRVAWRFDPWVGVALSLSHARFISALSPEPGDPRIVGGALDEWTRGSAALVIYVPGVM